MKVGRSIIMALGIQSCGIFVVGNETPKSIVEEDNYELTKIQLQDLKLSINKYEFKEENILLKRGVIPSNFYKKFKL